jgi:hypothetical protein
VLTGARGVNVHLAVLPGAWEVLDTQDLSRHLGCISSLCLAAGSELRSGSCAHMLAGSALELHIRQQWFAVWGRRHQ